MEFLASECKRYKKAVRAHLLQFMQLAIVYAIFYAIGRVLIELYVYVVAKYCQIIFMYAFFVFCNCSHATLSST